MWLNKYQRNDYTIDGMQQLINVINDNVNTIKKQWS